MKEPKKKLPPGMKLRLWRVRRGWTQSQAAEFFRISQATQSLLENGLREPGADVARRIARLSDGEVEWP